MTAISDRIPRVLLLSVPGLRREDLPRMPFLGQLAASGACVPLAPGFPAVTCPVQATLTTGRTPAAHGVLANGVYDRAAGRLEMWTGPDGVHRAPRIWDRLRQTRPGLRTASWFALQSKHATADLVCLPAPKHNPDGTETIWCHTRPEPLYGRLRDSLGDFPLHRFWGPAAGIESSRWIARSFVESCREDPPHFAFVYLPHLDYAAQRTGPDSPPAHAACGELDAEIGRLCEDFGGLVGRDDLVVLVAGEYRIRPVTHTLFPNRILREAGLLAIDESSGGELLDLQGSAAWALADHQLGHVYLRDGGDRRLVEHVASLFRGREGVMRVLTGGELVQAGLATTFPLASDARCGDVVVESALHSWQSYAYWLDDAKAPAFVRTIDIHRKPGYDPLELHIDRTKLPAVVIPLDASLVRGSHGAVDPADPYETILIASRPGLVGDPIEMHQIAGLVERMVLGRSAGR
ncbi:MAG: alkaline phosphatase family protein [Planctomycetia bacterium]|nr:alkaline phosphatase family protein [Planctomycetia bacterium]